MVVRAGNVIAFATRGRFYDVECGDAPATPTIVTASGTNSIVVTVSGSDAGSTNYCVYKGSGDTSWQDGGERSGDGDVTITGLVNDVPYIVEVYSSDGALYSTPALAMIVTLAESNDNDYDDMLESDVDIFLDAFAETGIYQPAGGGERSIQVIVDREPPKALDGVPGSISQHTIISVANDSTLGISSSEVDTGGDKVSITSRIGDTAISRRITKIINQDHGMMMLEIQ